MVLQTFSGCAKATASQFAINCSNFIVVVGKPASGAMGISVGLDCTLLGLLPVLLIKLIALFVEFTNYKICPLN
jgi:hypothetical protein